MSGKTISRRKFLKRIGIIASVTAVSIGGYTYLHGSNRKKLHLRIGYQPSTHQIAHMTAMEKGWWYQALGECGVELISEYEFPSGPPEMQAMLAGDLDVAYVGATPPITAIGVGLDAKIIANVNTQGSHLVVSPRIEYEEPEDLLGLKIATFPPGSIQDTVLKKWLERKGINADDEIDLVAMGPGDAVTAMAAKAVDAAFLPHPYPAIIELEGNGNMVLASGVMWPNHTCCCLTVTGELIREHPDIVEQVIRIHVMSTEYNVKYPDEAAEIYARKIGWEVDKVKYSLKTWDGYWIHDPHVGMESTLEYAEVHYKLGYVNRPLIKEDLFDTSFYDKIM